MAAIAAEDGEDTQMMTGVGDIEISMTHATTAGVIQTEESAESPVMENEAEGGAVMLERIMAARPPAMIMVVTHIHAGAGIRDQGPPLDALPALLWEPPEDSMTAESVHETGVLDITPTLVSGLEVEIDAAVETKSGIVTDPIVVEDEMEGMDEEAKMMALMGFAGFNSTAGKKVVGTDASAVAINKQRTYRQYMNRRQGFNRELSPTK
ncbi:hypothetical protein HKX48_006742 [Thoreauomyces humboldtii]|nr:hypothetical protein HKX48_006742 [Thoreauomyces humboldtii]